MPDLTFESFVDCDDPGPSSLNWPFDQPLDNLINPETLGSWNTENCALFQPSLDGLGMFNDGVDFSMPSQSSTGIGHDLGGGSLVGRQHGLVHSSNNGPTSQGLFTMHFPLVL